MWPSETNTQRRKLRDLRRQDLRDSNIESAERRHFTVPINFLMLGVNNANVIADRSNPALMPP